MSFWKRERTTGSQSPDEKEEKATSHSFFPQGPRRQWWAVLWTHDRVTDSTARPDPTADRSSLSDSLHSDWWCECLRAKPFSSWGMGGGVGQWGGQDCCSLLPMQKPLRWRCHVTDPTSVLILPTQGRGLLEKNPQTTGQESHVSLLVNKSMHSPFLA